MLKSVKSTLLVVSCCVIAFLTVLGTSTGSAAAADWTLRQLPPRYLDENSEAVSASLNGSPARPIPSASPSAA